MNEFKQFREFIPRFWREDGVLIVIDFGTRQRPKGRPRLAKWIVGLAASAIALNVVVTSIPFTVPDAGAARRTSIEDEIGAPSAESPFAEVSPEHWTKLRDLMKGFASTRLMDEGSDPELSS
jgi:hypothetical protein